MAGASLRTLTASMACAGGAAATIMIDFGFSPEGIALINSYFSVMIAVVAVLAGASASRFYLVMTRPHSTRNTSIRTRKIRGEDNLLSSISISEREEGPEGIEGGIRCEKRRWGNQYGTARQREKLRSLDFIQTKVELHCQTAL